MDPAERRPADVAVRVEVGDARLERVPVLVDRRQDVLDEQVEQQAQVGALGVLLGRRPAGLGVRVDDRELDLRLVGVEVEEQLVDLVHDVADARASGRSTLFTTSTTGSRAERLAQHEARLRQQSLGGVDEQHHPVDHRQPPLDLAAEVGVAGDVDQVELHLAVAGRRRSWPGS